MFRSHFLFAWALLPGALVGAVPAVAAGESGPAPPPRLAARDTAGEPGAPFANMTPAGDARLAEATGMADMNSLQQAANLTIASTVSGNFIQGDPNTGTISIGGEAFSAFNGLALINANTGNNVSMNAAMNVNVAILQ